MTHDPPATLLQHFSGGGAALRQPYLRSSTTLEEMASAGDEGLVSSSQCGIKALRGAGPLKSKGRGPMAKELEQISELESRKVAEASRETEWKQP
ncbi:MAG TPA: hypothetical protein VIJ36_06315, partial [Thermoanaerobaculia bacterium]